MIVSYESVESQGFENVLAAVALTFSLLSLAYSYLLARENRGREEKVKSRDDRIEKSTAYFGLELASMDVFRYQAAHWQAIDWACSGDTHGCDEARLSEEADQFFYQCLNLFEIASRFRRQDVIAAPIYASWVAWFYECLEYPLFRRRWVEQYRDNYTSEIREIMDFGVSGAIDWSSDDVNAQRQLFYERVGEICECGDIKQWRVPLPVERAGEAEADGRAAEETPAVAAGGLAMRWNDPADRADAARFAGAVVAQSSAYISHGEIQAGLSDDGTSWVPDLAERYAEEFADPGDRDMLVGRDDAGQVRAFLIVAWEASARRKFAVIEDMAVDPELRGQGTGGALLAMAQERIRSRGVEWVFLESGIGNEGAHHFFERAGFAITSHVFAKRLES